MTWIIDLDGLEPSMAERCEKEFQKQADYYDGELFWYFDVEFKKVDLRQPSTVGQVILSHFANSGCPVNGMRFGVSLHPFLACGWPIKSSRASTFYILRGLEIIVDLYNEPRMKTSLNKFECTEEHMELIKFAEYVIRENSLEERLCPEILRYIQQYMPIPRDLNNSQIH